MDDNSQDGTLMKIKAIQKVNQHRIHFLQRGGKLGLGSAYIAGFQWGLSNNYKYFVQMDADLSHNPKELPIMFSLLKDYSLVIACRYVSGGDIENWGMLRQSISRFGSLYAKKY